MKKKILIIHTTLGGGGAEKVLIDILKHFDYETYDVSLFLLFKTGVYMDKIPPQVHLIEKDFGVRFRHPFGRLMILSGVCGWLMKRCAKRVFSGKRYDTIVSFMEGGAAKFHGYMTDKAQRNVSWVHINLAKFHYTKTTAFPWPGQERRFYKKMDEVVFVSQDAEAQFGKLFSLDKGVVIYNLIDRLAICRLAEQPAELPRHDKFTFVNVGRLSPQKRQDRIVEVASLCKRRGGDMDFWIVGAGGLEDALKKQAAEMGVSDCIHFIGFKSNPYPYIKAADAFLLTSDTEGFPLVVAEAMCLGKPIVSTRVTGPEEMLDGGKYGLLTSMDTKEIANAAISLAGNGALCAELSQKSLSRACSLFDVQETMRQIYKVIG